MKNKIIKIGLLIIIVIMFSSCIHVVDVGKCLPVDGKVYGFWNGLWHGMIAGFSFIGSLFNHDIAIYAINNNGGWYNFGFLLGVGGTLGGSSSGVKTSRNRRNK